MFTQFKNLNLRFLGEEGDGAGGDEQTPVVDQGQQGAPEQGGSGQQSQGNPAWAGLRSELDPITFGKIEPHLKEWETAAQKRVETANSSFAPFQSILKDRQPEWVGKAVTYAEMLDKEPERVYQMLGQFLQQTGRMPSAAEAEEQLDAPEGQEGQKPVTDPRLDVIAQQQQAVLDYIGQQQQQESLRQADIALSTALTGLRDAHKELSDEDQKEIVSRAAFAAQQTPGKDIDFPKSLETAYTEFVELKNRILSTPRPGDSAPTLVPTSGGTPSAPNQQQKSWGQYSNDEIQNFVAAQLQQKG